MHLSVQIKVTLTNSLVATEIRKENVTAKIKNKKAHGLKLNPLKTSFLVAVQV